MNELFREQLLNAGLVSKKQAKAAVHQENVSRKQRRKRNKSGDASEAPTLQDAQAALEAKRAQDRELNLARAAAKREQALVAQVNDLITQHALSGWKGDVDYHFSDGGKVKTLRVSPTCQKELGDGVTGIAIGSAGYVIVPRTVALKIEERVPERLVLLNEPDVPLAEDDPYAEFPVPDDLMW